MVLPSNIPKASEGPSQEITPYEGTANKQSDSKGQRLEYHLEMARMDAELERLRASIREAEAEKKLKDFKEEVRYECLSPPFKLRGNKNYDDWSEEILEIALFIDARAILKDRQLTCPEDIKDEGDIEIWKFKSKTLFRAMYPSLKPWIKRLI